ncbi:MAG: taurine dioxygenase, partial [Actinomycetota bacterium]
MTTTTSTSIMKVEPCTTAIGAEISGIQIAEAVTNNDLFNEIKQLWLKHKVLFFREQNMSLQQHHDFAQLFGTLEDHPVAPSHPDFPGLVLIQRQKERSTYENVWHADATWRHIPPKGAILRCEVVPEVGGDTMWANMAMAYDRLPDRIKERIGDLWAIHSIEQSFGGNMTPEARAELVEQYPPARHPVVC